MYYNADGSPFFNKKGVCGIERWYGIKNRVIEERYYVGEGVRGKSTDGYSGVQRSYNKKGKLVYERYIDEDNQLMVVPALGYAKIQNEYHNGNHIKTVSYYDDQNQLTAGPEGAAVVDNTYVFFNNLTTTVYYGTDGKTPVNSIAGYARSP